MASAQLRISFTIAGTQIFASDQLFSITARDFYSSDVFNESELIAVMEKHATVVFDKGSIVRAWRKTVANQYSNRPVLDNYITSWYWGIMVKIFHESQK